MRQANVLRLPKSHSAGNPWILESISFEDAVRNAVSLGGDTDTMACIAGSIAEAFYQNSPEGISPELKAQCREILSATKHDEFLAVIDRFEKELEQY